MKTEEEKGVEYTEGLSFQQKLWRGTGTFFYAIKPLLLYLLLPSLLMCMGMLLSGKRTAQDMVDRSGQFYYTLGILLTLYLLYRRRKKAGGSFFEEVTLEYRELDRGRLLCLAGIGLGLALFFSALVTVVPLPEALIGDYLESSGSWAQGTDQVLALLSTILLAPVAEEIIFRGYMLNRLLGWFGQRESILISSVIFALCHVSPLWILYAFAMGAALAWISMKEDNIAYSMALHIGFNFNVLPVWLINQSPAASRFLFADHRLVAAYGGAACLMAVCLIRRYGKETA